MKRFILFTVCALSIQVMATPSQEGQISTSAPSPSGNSFFDKGNSMDASLTYSSINNGTPFTTVGVTHEWDNGFAVGARGYLPMQYSKPADAYMLQALARFIFLNDVNQVFADGTLTHGFFSANGGENGFNMLGVEFGYTRRLAGNFTVGGLIGVDYSGEQISGNTIVDGGTFYNKLAVTAGYLF